MQKRSAPRAIHGSLFSYAIASAILLGALAPWSAAHAADLAISPSSSTVIVGKPFTLTLTLKNNDTAINAVSGEISFPPDMLSVSSLSETDSILKLWADDPHYSNDAGTVQFEGVIMNPGFSGSGGTVLSVTFMPKKTGNADISYTTGSVLANDGKGTSVLGTLGASHLVIATSAQSFSPSASSPSPSSTPLTPAASSVSSNTHPDPNKWYDQPNATFSWNVPSDVTAVRLLADTSPSSVPTHLHTTPISTIDVPDNADGVHYFHLQFKNAHGWGAVSHFRYQVDTTPPAPFTVTFPQGDSTDNPEPQISFVTTDTPSGVDHYEIKVGDAPLLTYVPDGSGSAYTLPIQEAGKHTVIVRALDKAGNSTTESADFTIQAINPPTFTRVSTELQQGDAFKIHGTTYPSASVDVTMTDANGASTTENVKSDSSGNFSLAWTDTLAPGVYRLNGVVTDSRGAKSAASDAISITVDEKAFIRIGTLVITYFTLGLVSILALAGLVFLAWYLVHKFNAFRRSISKTVSSTEAALQKDFADLKKEMKDHLRTLERVGDKRDLTKEEKTILDCLEKRLAKIDGDVEERLKPLKK